MKACFRTYADPICHGLGGFGSHWLSKNPTGDSEQPRPPARTWMMMLYSLTAKYVDSKIRLSAEQNSRRSQVFNMCIWTRFPDRIEEPDRTWFCFLASITFGFGHLGGRTHYLTEQAGRNSATAGWMYKEFSGTLTQKEMVQPNKFGYARRPPSQ